MTDWQPSALEIDPSNANPQVDDAAPTPTSPDPPVDLETDIATPPFPATEGDDGAATEEPATEATAAEEQSAEKLGEAEPTADGLVPEDAPGPPHPTLTADRAAGDHDARDHDARDDGAHEVGSEVVTEALPGPAAPPVAQAAGPAPNDIEESTPPSSSHAAIARGRPLPRAVAVANQKGGVGKTTTAVNLGAALAELGYRVLVVDLDPQGNATTGLGINPRNLTGSVYDVLMNDAPLEDCIEPTAVRNLFVVPATIDLAGAEIELVPAFSRELKLRRAIDRLAGEFDFTLIDCPPSLGLLTVNGLAAAGEVLVPIQCEYYALEGLGQLIKNIQLVQSNLNPRLELSTIVLTMYDARTRLSDQVAKDVREHFGAKVCRTIVPRTVRLSEAPSFGQPINVFDPSSRGATAYRELAKEVSGGTARRSG